MAGLVVLHIVLALLVFRPAPHTGGDNAGYITLARSLLEGHGYRDLYDPATPPHTQYPPVFPLMLALALAVGVRPWVGVKLLIVACSALSVALSYLWIRRRRGPELALPVAAFLAISPGVLELSHWELSDVPFWAFTMLALWGYERWRPATTGAAGLDARMMIAIAATTLAYFTRSAGLPLVIAAFAWLALRRHWRPLVALAAVFVPLAFLWWLRARAHGGVSYVEQFWAVNPYQPELGRITPPQFLGRIIENDRHYLIEHVPQLLIGQDGLLTLPLSGALIALAVFGWIRRMRRPGVAELFLPLYTGLLFSWPAVWSGERLLLPLLPLLLVYAGETLVRAARHVQRGATAFACAAALVLLVLAATPMLALDIERGVACTRGYLRGDRFACVPRPWRDFFRAAEWSRSGLPQHAVVLSRKPRLFYVLSGHRGRVYPLSRDTAEFFRAAQEIDARYVVLDRMDELSSFYLLPVLARAPGAFCAVRSFGPTRTVLLGLREPPPADADRTLELGPSLLLPLELCPPEYWRAPARARPSS